MGTGYTGRAVSLASLGADGADFQHLHHRGNDLLTNYDRISDHCANIAGTMIELEYDAFDTHNYLDSLMGRKDERFHRSCKEYEKRLSLDGEVLS